MSANSLWNIVNFRSGLVQALSGKGFEVVVAAPNDLGRRQINLPAEHVDIPVDRSGVNPLTDGMLVARYLQLLRARRPAAYLSYTIKPNIYGALAARMAGVPSIANVSGLGTAFIRGGLFARFISGLYRAAFSRAHVVFFQNPDDRDLFITRRIVSPAVARLLPGSGVNLGHFRPVAPPSHQCPVFLFIGRLLTDKGVREFVEAARMVAESCPGARFQILGPLDDGNRTAVSKVELDGWIESGKIEYLGVTDDVRPFIGAASAIVLPSYREGLPRSLLEGAAMARPLIATDVPGCREIVRDGDTGFLFEARNAASLADALSRFIALDENERAAMGEAGRSVVEREYSEQVVVDAYIEALQPLTAFPTL